MQKVTLPGEDHGDAGLVGGGDDLVVAQRAAGLDHGGHAGGDSRVDAVGERVEGVAGAGAPLGPTGRLLDRKSVV